MAKRFTGKTVLVTGASRGQGASHAARFAEEDANVVITDVLDVEGEALAAKLAAAGHAAIYVPLDVANEQAWSVAITRIEREFGGLHVLINNAGIPLRQSSMLTLKVADWDRIMKVNLTGPFLGMRASVQLIRASGGGAIVNIGSIAGMTGHFATAYSASKWGLRGLTKSAAMEFADWNIRVNAVHPGIVRTPIVEGSDDFVEAMSWMTPLGRIAESEEMSQVVLFLASNDASFLTGLDIAADGGFTELGAYRRVLRRVQEGANKLL